MKALHARGIGCTYGTVRAIISGKQDRRNGRQTTQRFAPTRIDDRVARLPAIDSAAMRELRTLYPHTVVREFGQFDVLKHGKHSSKIGDQVLKGKWRGMPIYTLTLEERATCPVECRHLRSCFGNKMQFAKRHAHGAKFERALVSNVLALGRAHRSGFVVRLHVLGDFYSVPYVQLWEVLLGEVPSLHVFGYTARWADDVGLTLRKLVRDHWDRFAVRFSNAPTDELPATASIELPVQCPATAFLCPEQTNKTESCATCGACWGTRKRVAFLQH